VPQAWRISGAFGMVKLTSNRTLGKRSSQMTLRR
jgi:hypothetical protein